MSSVASLAQSMLVELRGGLSVGSAHGGEGPQARRAERPQRGDAAVAHPAMLQANRHDQALRVARNGGASGHVEDFAAGTSQTKQH